MKEIMLLKLVQTFTTPINQLPESLNDEFSEPFTDLFGDLLTKQRAGD